MLVLRLVFLFLLVFGVASDASFTNIADKAVAHVADVCIAAGTAVLAACQSSISLPSRAILIGNFS